MMGHQNVTLLDDTPLICACEAGPLWKQNKHYVYCLFYFMYGMRIVLKGQYNTLQYLIIDTHLAYVHFPSLEKKMCNATTLKWPVWDMYVMYMFGVCVCNYMIDFGFSARGWRTLLGS